MVEVGIFVYIGFVFVYIGLLMINEIIYLIWLEIMIWFYIGLLWILILTL